MSAELGSQSKELLGTSKSQFVEMLEARWSENKFVCVGLDSDFARIPQIIKLDQTKSPTQPYQLNHVARIMFAFNKEIIDATADLVCAYKPNAAFYEGVGGAGLQALEETISYIKDKYPNIPVLYDAKRGDIGNTNLGYVESAFSELRADAVTVHPYLGKEAMQPFLDKKDKGVVVLARTSNPGAGQFQDLPVHLGRLTPEYQEKFGIIDGLRELGSDVVPLYQLIAYSVAHHWNENGNCALVIGATYPQELEKVRVIVGDLPILLPGIGAQGGEVEATVKAGKDSKNQGMIINASRSIIFASQGEDFAEAARQETLRLTEQINNFR